MAQLLASVVRTHDIDIINIVVGVGVGARPCVWASSYEIIGVLFVVIVNYRIGR